MTCPNCAIPEQCAKSPVPCPAAKPQGLLARFIGRHIITEDPNPVVVHSWNSTDGNTARPLTAADLSDAPSTDDAPRASRSWAA